MVTRWSVEKLLSFHSAVPDFQNGKDTPRDYLERCLVTIEARDHEVKAFVTLNLDGARPVGQAADETAFLKAGDQTVDTGLGFQAQGILHFVKGGGNAVLLELLIEINQKFVLFPGQHRLYPNFGGGFSASVITAIVPNSRIGHNI